MCESGAGSTVPVVLNLWFERWRLLVEAEEDDGVAAGAAMGSVEDASVFDAD